MGHPVGFIVYCKLCKLGPSLQNVTWQRFYDSTEHVKLLSRRLLVSVHLRKVMPLVVEMKHKNALIVVRKKYVNTSGDQSVTPAKNQLRTFDGDTFYCFLVKKINFIMYILHVSRLFIKSSEKQASCLEVTQHCRF